MMSFLVMIWISDLSFKVCLLWFLTFKSCSVFESVSLYSSTASTIIFGITYPRTLFNHLVLTDRILKFVIFSDLQKLFRLRICFSVFVDIIDDNFRDRFAAFGRRWRWRRRRRRRNSILKRILFSIIIYFLTKKDRNATNIIDLQI